MVQIAKFSSDDEEDEVEEEETETDAEALEVDDEVGSVTKSYSAFTFTPSQLLPSCSTSVMGNSERQFKASSYGGGRSRAPRLVRL